MSVTHRRLNHYIASISAGEVAVGCFLTSGDLHRARLIADSDLDFVIVDMEHQGFDFPGLCDTLQWLLSPRQMRRTGVTAVCPTPLVRLPANCGEDVDWLVKQTLDAGAFGLVMPRLQGAADVERVVRAARYPQGPDGPEPKGHRGIFPGLAARYWGCDSLEDYIACADVWPLSPDGEIALVFLVEDAKGFDEIGKIAAAPGVSGILFGGGDGGLSLGSLAPDFPPLVEARAHVLSTCSREGVPVGLAMAGSQGDEPQALDRLQFVVIEPDLAATFGRESLKKSVFG